MNRQLRQASAEILTVSKRQPQCFRDGSNRECCERLRNLLGNPRKISQTEQQRRTRDSEVVHRAHNVASPEVFDGIVDEKAELLEVRIDASLRHEERGRESVGPHFFQVAIVAGERKEFALTIPEE